MKKFVLIFLLCGFLCGCGYHLRGTGSSLPSHIARVHVPMFTNSTTRFELELKLTQKIIDEMVARGKVEVTADKSSAEATLIGDVITFVANPIAFSGEGSADRYNITVVAKITLRDLTNNRVIFSNPNFAYQEEYEVPEGSDFETVESEAIDKIAEKFARSLMITILEGF